MCSLVVWFSPNQGGWTDGDVGETAAAKAPGTVRMSWPVGLELAMRFQEGCPLNVEERVQIIKRGKSDHVCFCGAIFSFDRLSEIESEFTSTKFY